MARNDAVQTAINAMKAARHGGDYAAIFQGKQLAFKYTAIKEATSELMDQGEEIAETLEPVGELMAESGVGQAVLALGRLIQAGGEMLLQGLRQAFHHLLEVFDALRDALATAFGPILAGLGLALEALINLLIDLLPNVFVEFVKGLVAAVLPFIGQIKACGDMLVSVCGVVGAAVQRYQLGRAGAALDPSNRFTTAARSAMDQILTGELTDAGVEAVLDTGNAAASVTGLIFTGNVGSMVASIAVAVAKLCVKVAGILDTLKEMRAGNALLARMGADPRRDVNPAALFATAPILGAHYIATATQSSLIANTGFLDSLAVKMTFTDAGWMAEYESKARQLSPFRLKAMRLVAAHPLELTNAGMMGVYFDFNLKDEVSERVGEAVGAHAGKVLAKRFLPA
ncbi:hypothetical protein [Ideonella livida]|uniref:Uncharacterized protein n=1 Tax=Ideonella livida TaxID=2707176 RepID=A0A7C9PGV8_9BURK|nr:hypothetical protein [Ideonella livida]NDY91349.1 hypothetical protein [Ideonella livida]